MHFDIRTGITIHPGSEGHIFSSRVDSASSGTLIIKFNEERYSNSLGPVVFLRSLVVSNLNVESALEVVLTGNSAKQFHAGAPPTTKRVVPPQDRELVSVDASI